MALLQIPTPPPAPDPVLIGGGGGPPEVVFIAATLIAGFIILGVVLYPLIRAFARRLEGRGAVGADPALLERVADLEHRLADAEERIDFNERMLAQREPLALPRDKAD
jgi:alkanesulfonate monooxygenase SsuD/methylene tetrahydromethanopterin reductase-like flavin-dependent oxidoreductase (luciferase family)